MIGRINIRILAALAVLAIATAMAFAHNGIEHVMGTVTAVTDNSITVDTVRHTSVTVVVDASTTFTHKDAKASIRDLKTGDRIVLNTKEGVGNKPHAVSVRWGATADRGMTHAHHKM